jgi:hypothetical protein
LRLRTHAVLRPGLSDFCLTRFRRHKKNLSPRLAAPPVSADTSVDETDVSNWPLKADL